MEPPSLHNNILREIYARANMRTQLKMREATKAVHEMPASKPTGRLARRRLLQIIKKVQRLEMTLVFVGHTSPILFNIFRDMKASYSNILSTYSRQPAQAARLVMQQYKRWKTLQPYAKDVAVLERIANSANMPDSRRRELLAPYIVKLARSADKKFSDLDPFVQQRIIDPFLRIHPGVTRKNLNSYVSRGKQGFGIALKRSATDRWKYGTSASPFYAIGMLATRKHTRRKMRIQRRAQRRQERGQQIA